MAALDHAFNCARYLLKASDYFVLIRRHGLLRRLPLDPALHPPLALEELLTTAAVIERLTKTY